jgi:hypothetical protein
MPASFSYAQPSEANSIVSEDVEHLKQRWPLFDYLQQQNWAARPAGYDSEFVGLCPLHQETRPSFYVNARKNLFYCHGCGQGGDLIRFVELSRHLSFRQSLAYLEQQSAPPVDSVDSANFRRPVMESRITGTTMPVLEFLLTPNESIISEAGELSWMGGSIQMTTHTQFAGGGVLKTQPTAVFEQPFFEDQRGHGVGPGMVHKWRTEVPLAVQSRPFACRNARDGEAKKQS